MDGNKDTSSTSLRLDHYPAQCTLSDLELGVGKSAAEAPLLLPPRHRAFASAFASSNFFPGIIHDLACNHFVIINLCIGSGYPS
jgi:hypothetical protein